MKTNIKILSAVFLSTAIMACNSNQEQTTSTEAMETDESLEYIPASGTIEPGEYIDLNTGKTVYIVADPQTRRAVDSISRRPVEFYVNPNTRDTLYATGAVVNNAIVQSNGKWTLDDTKVKRDGDEIKIKYGNGDKTKIDGDDMKIKDSEGKIKVDDGGEEIKVKPDSN